MQLEVSNTVSKSVEIAWLHVCEGRKDMQATEAEDVLNINFDDCKAMLRAAPTRRTSITSPAMLIIDAANSRAKRQSSVDHIFARESSQIFVKTNEKYRTLFPKGPKTLPTMDSSNRNGTCLPNAS